MSARKTNLNAALLGCTALVLLMPMQLSAQESAQTAKTGDDGVVLQTITIGGVAAQDDDAGSVVAASTTGGSKMASDILDTPASVSVITAKEMRDRGTSSVEQVLAYTPGVVTDFYGSDDRFDFFRIRGFDAYTFRDGLSLGRAFGGVREEPFAFERVEVIKGANSAAFGISDPGGSVNYITKRPTGEKSGEVYVTGGSFSHAEIGFDIGDRLTPDNTLSFRLTGKLKSAEKEYDYSQDDETFLMGGLTWKPTDATSLTIIADYLKREATPGSGGHPIGVDLDRSVFLGEPDYNFRDTDRKTLTAILEHDFGGGLSFGSNLRYSKAKTNFGYAYVYDMTPTDTLLSRYFFGNESEAESTTLDARLQYDTRFGTTASRTLVGLEYWDTDSSTANFYGYAPSIDWTNPVYSGAPDSVPVYQSLRNDQKGTGIYVQEELTFQDRFILSLGLRHDWMDLSQTNRLTGIESSGDSSETTHRAALTWKITPEISAYGSYAESVAPASLTVEPERGKQTEVGVKYRPDGTRALLSAAVYDLKKTNITVTNPITSALDTIGKVRVKGVELEARAEILDGVSLIAGWSRMDSEIVENGTGGNEGNRVPFVPEEEASLWATYTLAGQGEIGDMTFGLGARFAGSYYYDNGNMMKNAGFTTFDASYSYQIREDTAVSVNVSNLFDKKAIAYGGYGADWFNPGREISATLRHTW